jgi:asparagine N-glycosylation enzyme membrane subunit Stt3
MGRHDVATFIQPIREDIITAFLLSVLLPFILVKKLTRNRPFLLLALALLLVPLLATSTARLSSLSTCLKLQTSRNSQTVA